MHIRSLRLQHVRSHTDISVELSPRVTVIAGPNGSGKTTCIEAIYYELRGHSFRGLTREMVSSGAEWFRIDLVGSDEVPRTAKYDVLRKQRSFEIDTQSHARLPKKHHYPIVLFEPDDLRLLSGSPARRREYIDQLIAQINPSYTQIIRRYERALLQRNKLLKQPVRRADDLFAWNVTLSEYGARIVHERAAITTKLNEQFEAVYQEIADKNDTVSITYPHHEYTQQTLLHTLEQSTERDYILGTTTVGPHRHDIDIIFNNRPAKETASRGEVRTTILALKFIELKTIEQETGLRPLLLLDDVFGELDAARRRNLAHTFASHQVVITTTEPLTGLPRQTKTIQL